MNPEILKMNPKVNLVKINTNMDLKFDSKSSSNSNIFFKPKIDIKHLQTRKPLVSLTKKPLLLEKKSPLKSKNSSLPIKLSINKSRKGHFFTQSKNLTKSKMITEFHPNDLIALHTGPKRDSRTIEEIQNDLWRRKGKNYPFLKNTPETNNTSLNKISSKNQVSKDLTSQDPSSDIVYKKAKTNIQDKNETLNSSISSEIWKIFGKRKEDYVLKDYNSDSDMEATGAELQREEEFSAKIGKFEDKEEERKEAERRIKKKKRKLGIS